MKKNSDTRVITLAVFSCLLWSSAFVGIKSGLKYSSPLFFAGMRFFLSGLILIPFSGKIGLYFKNFKIHFKKILIISLFQTILLYSTLFIGMTFVPSAIGAIIIGSSPLIVSIASHISIKDDKLNLKKLISIFIGISGIVLIAISRKPLTSKGQFELLGILIMIVGVSASAIGNIIVSKQKQGINPVFLNSTQIGLGGIILFLISIPAEQFKKITFNKEFIVSLIWLALLSAVAFSIWFYLLQKSHYKVSSLNVWKFIIPVFGAILSWLIIPDENPEFITVIGMIIVSLSIVIFYFPSKILFIQKKIKK